MLSIQQINRAKLHNGSIYTVVKGEDENTFLSGGSEGIVIKWNVLKQDQAMAIARVEGQIFSLLYLPGKNHLMMGTMAGNLHVIDLNLKKEIHNIQYHEQSIFDLKLHGDEIFATSKDGTFSVWSTIDYGLKRIVSLSDLSLRSIDFHPQKKEAAIGGSDNKVYIVDLTSWKTITILEGPDNSVFSVQYLMDGRQLLAGSRNAQLYLYDTEDQRLLKQIKAHLYTINHIQLIVENNFFATASRDKTIRIWNASTFELVKSLDHEKYDGHVNSVNKLLWLPSHHYLISGSDDRSIITWKIEVSS